jgi:hypothetical protein
VIFQPAILALLLASGASAAALLALAPFALAIVRDWNIRSGSERQLVLERRTYLLSTVVTIVLAVQLLSLLLFVLNADRMAALFTGAMCAAGTLNVDAYGFPSLLAQVAVFFLAAAWLAINHADVQSPDYPLVRTKYKLLLGLTPVVAGAFALQLLYFLGLKADIVTSCCSRVFTGAANGLSGDMAALAPTPAMALFYGGLGLAIGTAGYTARTGRGGYATAATGLAAFAAVLVGIVSFLSLYIYEAPQHHCPFCVLKAEYGYRGYFLYAPLFAATACGIGAGAVRAFARVEGLHGIAPRFSARLAGLAAAGFTLVLAAATVMIFQSRLILISRNGVTP